ncbi:TetR family transcriptional regulator [Leptolyngbya sp. FACHB-321]|uniref:TetR/AcrR family transcriptional regulator n=1 Tax=Leptolyngbya sp. FACHB-321 TaxID=2692807 RepID=UPI00168322B6|nr:TetR/AcrR family transcriptional regulator [Leptolyngbya sp. FACHB-321]MBD2037687.1 TetR family transcriptional regulator [Leptolyngbya sp. FACHB-321]
MSSDSSKASSLRRLPQQDRSAKRVNHILNTADALFAELGFESATMVEIAARAQTSVGSLYRFFPDKVSILEALALCYLDQLQQVMAELHTPAAIHEPLTTYVDRVSAAFNQFFLSHPGFRTIFVDSYGVSSEILAIKTQVDRQIAEQLATFYAQRIPNLTTEDAEVIALVMVSIVSKLHTLAFSRDEEFQARMMVEVKRLILLYLQSYLSSGESP